MEPSAGLVSVGVTGSAYIQTIALAHSVNDAFWRLAGWWHTLLLAELFSGLLLCAKADIK